MRGTVTSPSAASALASRAPIGLGAFSGATLVSVTACRREAGSSGKSMSSSGISDRALGMANSSSASKPDSESWNSAWADFIILPLPV